MFFDIIFNMSDLLGDSFSFSSYSTEFLGEEGVLRELFVDMKEHNSDSLSIGSVCFSFSEGSGPELIYEEWIKDKSGEMLLRKIGGEVTVVEEIDVVTTRGFFSDKDRVFREMGGAIIKKCVKT